MEDIVGQEINVGDIIAVAYKSSYSLQGKKQHLAVVIRVSPKSIKVYMRVKRNLAYTSGAVETFDIASTNEKVIKLESNLHNQKLFLRGIELDSKQKEELIILFKNKE